MSTATDPSSLLIVADLVMEVALQAEAQKVIAKARADIRYPLQKPVPLGIKGVDGKPYRKLVSTWGIDVSYRAMGLVSTTPVTVGATYWADLRVFNRADWILPVKILRCDQLLKDLYHVAAEFLDE